MKNFVSQFVLRGMVASSFGPLALVVLYLVMQNCGKNFLTINEVCIGIISIAVLAFVAGGMNAIYQIERLPLLWAILIHGIVLYLSYLATYLINGWLDFGATPIMVFSAIFVVGYIVIWIIIYSITKRNTAKLNKALKQKQNLIEE